MLHKIETAFIHRLYCARISTGKVCCINLFLPKPWRGSHFQNVRFRLAKEHAAPRGLLHALTLQRRRPQEDAFPRCYQSYISNILLTFTWLSLQDNKHATQVGTLQLWCSSPGTSDSVQGLFTRLLYQRNWTTQLSNGKGYNIMQVGNRK